MKKIIITTILLILGSLGYFLYHAQKTSKVEPSEELLKEYYVESINQNNESAKKQFGPMMKKDEKLEVVSFHLNGCKEDKDLMHCISQVQLKTLNHGIENKKVDFTVKRQGERIDYLSQKEMG